MIAAAIAPLSQWLRERGWTVRHGIATHPRLWFAWPVVDAARLENEALERDKVARKLLGVK